MSQPGLNTVPEAFYADSSTATQWGFTRPHSYSEAQRKGIEVLGVDINRSNYDYSLQEDTQGKPCIRVGLRAIKGLKLESVQQVLLARAAEPSNPYRTCATKRNFRANT